MIAFVFKPKRRAHGKLKPARTFSGRYRLSGEIKVTTVALGVGDKQVAEEKLRKIVREAEREREGLSPSKEHREAANRPLEKFVDEYLQTKHGLGRNEKYVRELGRKLHRLIREIDWRTVQEITAHSFEAWRARVRQTLSPKTLNEYYDAIFGLCKWLETRVGKNSMRSVQKVDASGGPEFERHAFTPGELARLIEVSGERGIVYGVAASTGIRRGELAQIQWRDVQIDDARPYIRVRASIAKNRKVAYQPLPPSIATALKKRRVNVAPSDLVFKRLIPRMNRFRGDLTAAGIPHVDDKGALVHFHGLRKTYSTLLMLLGVPEFVRMKLMRHSDVKLTQKGYTDASMAPTWDVVAALPVFNDTQIDTQNLVVSGQAVSAAVPIEGHGPVLLAAGDRTVSPSESASVRVSPEVEENARCRVRTCDFLRVKQALYR
jgi:integrase